MDANTTVDEYIHSFMNEINALNDNAILPPATSSDNTNTRKRKRAPPKPKVEKTQKPGWVPKPTDDSPIVSWMEDGKLYAVQNPANTGSILLKMELYDGVEMVNMCGFYTDKESEMYHNIKHLLNKLENMWIDKASGVPKIDGLTQTVTNCTSVSAPKTRKRVLSKKRVTK